jgi:signal transduction histidine kinase
MVLEIKNNRLDTSRNLAYGNNGEDGGNASFTPRSISERAESLGGQTQVFTDDDNYTVVSVSIPLL